MPQIVLIVAVGAGLLVLRRLWRREQQRVAAELRAAKEAMDRRNIDHAVPLEQDPATGIYRPKHPH